MKTPIIKSQMQQTPGQALSVVKLKTESDSIKRKREEDDYDVP